MSIAPTRLALSGSRFSVTYAIAADPATARSIADNVRVEQTIEFPLDLIADDDIRHGVVGRIEGFETFGPDLSHCTISYADETSAFELPQLLNVILGNASLFRGVKVVRFDLSDAVAAAFRGPRFGTSGLRRLFDRPAGPLFMSALKPQGLSAVELARQASAFAAGGLDIVKDDHGLANQSFSPFRERVTRCADAVREANARTGGRSLYAPMLSGPAERLIEDALFARDAGAGALLLAPALIGLDAARRIAELDVLALPILGHPALGGGFVLGAAHGFSHRAYFGQVMRLIGMDATIFPNFGGRFAFTRDECRAITRGCGEAMNGFAPILPSPGGGMTFAAVPEMARFYGDDILYLMGGELHRVGDLTDACLRLRDHAQAAMAKEPAE